MECNTIYGHEVRKFQTTIDEVKKDENGNITSVIIKQVKFINGKFEDIPNTMMELPCDILIVAMGFLGTTDKDLESYHLKSNRNRVALNNFNYDKNIYVCGDMKNGQSLVVVAIADGLSCAEEIIKKYRGI